MEFAKFARAKWLNTQYLHLYQGEKLVAIAVTDLLPNSASAFYTFYDPDISISLGTLAVLCQLNYCQQTKSSGFIWDIKSMNAQL